LQRFTPFNGAGKTVPTDPTLPDYKRDVQFTVNGQFQPVIKSKAGQTEIWVQPMSTTSSTRPCS
jgi:hypothetical protein